MLLSVIIPTYQRPAQLCNLLQQFSSSERKQLFELIIVNDYPSAKYTLKNLGLTELGLNITFINNEKNKGRHKSLKHGLAYVKGKYTMLFDDDDDLISVNLDKFISHLAASNGIFYITPTNETFDYNTSERIFPNIYKYWRTIPKHSDSKEVLLTLEMKKSFSALKTLDKRVPTQLLWLQVESHIEYLPMILCKKNYLASGLSANIKSMKSQNQDSMRELFRFIITDQRAPLSWRVYYIFRIFLTKIKIH